MLAILSVASGIDVHEYLLEAGDVALDELQAEVENRIRGRRAHVRERRGSSPAAVENMQVSRDRPGAREGEGTCDDEGARERGVEGKKAE